VLERISNPNRDADQAMAPSDLIARSMAYRICVVARPKNASYPEALASWLLRDTFKRSLGSTLSGGRMAYPRPVPALKGKSARKLAEELEKRRNARSKNPRWAGSRKTYEKLRPKPDSD
jgi:hypothetical protein